MPEEEKEIYWLGPIKSFFLYHIVDSLIFWLGVLLIVLGSNESWASAIYNWLSGTPMAVFFRTAYEWGIAHAMGWWGVIMLVLAISRSYIRFKVTRFVIEHGVLIVTRGQFSLNPLCFFRRVDYTVALNLIYDVDVNKTIFQYIFGGGDVYVRTASQDIFHLEFVEDPHKLREYLLEHSGIKNKPVIGVY